MKTLAEDILSGKVAPRNKKESKIKEEFDNELIKLLKGDYSKSEIKPGYYMYEEDTHKRIYNISEITINKENVQLVHYHVIDCRYGDDRIEVLLNQVTELTERSGMVLELSKVKEMSAEEYEKYYDIIRMLLI